MNLNITTIAVILLPSLCAGADELKPIVSIPMRLNDSSQYWIEARFNGSDPISCNVDSGGGDRIYLDRDRAAKMGILPTGTGHSAGPQDRAMKQDSRAQVTLEVGGIKFVNQPVVLQSRPYADYSCNIGQTVFRQYVVEVDYVAPALRFHDSERFHYDGPGKVVPFTFDDGSPFVNSTVITPNGKPVQPRLAVDTGCGSGLAMLSKRFVDANNLMSDIQDAKPERRYGMEGQQAKVVSARFEKFTVGPFEIPRPAILLWQVQGFGGSNGPDGLLCGDFLRRFKLFFDYGNRRIILEPTARYRD